MRKIIHIDMDAFYASVEQRDNPQYRGRPLIVGGRPERRGVVAACSYEARQFGVHSAMPSSRALKLCADAVFVKPRFDAYREASQHINRIFRQYTPMIEPLSLDEAYLDVTAYASQYGSATEVARAIKQQINNELQLTASAGISYNKFLAKIASDMDKPDGLYVIRPEAAQAFIEQLEIRKFFGIGKVTEKKMHELGVYTGADLRKFSQIQLQTRFGRVGNYYYSIARGIDDRPVKASRQRKSLSSETTFENDVRDKKLVWQTLQRLAAGLEQTMTKKNLAARTLTLKVRYADFKIVTRSHTGTQLIQTEVQMLAGLPTLLKKTEVGGKPIRLIGINLSNFVAESDPRRQPSASEVRENGPGTRQMGLF
ncbi:MAG: DNA polymerase IV [Arenicella sp.]|nr:DNA polymerase IV [Arenicella sp.]